MNPIILRKENDLDTSKLAYILYEYEEHGPEHMIITFDKTKLRGYIENWYADSKTDDPRRIQLNQEEIRKTLEYFDKITDFETVGKANLGLGWGGITLAIVELDKVHL